MINIVWDHKAGWILSRLAQSLADGIPGARAVDQRDRAAIHAPDVALNYYVNDWAMSAHRPNRKAKSVVFLDHPKGDTYLRQADAIICMAPQYQRYAERTLKKPTYLVVQPTDTGTYTPRLRLGFVGRFRGQVDYGDRKGRDLLRQVEALPFVDLRCTMGNVANADMPDFYRSLDAVIVPAKVEGGPMCLTEGLACGVPVIMPVSVGVGELFKDGIIDYNAQDFVSLRRVLEGLYQTKMDRHNLVARYTWENWVNRHTRIFNHILGRDYMDGKQETCLYTTAIGAYGVELGTISIPLMQAWARNLGWDFHCFRDQGEHKTPSWVRLDIGPHMRDNGYVRGCYVDLDAVVDPSAPDPFNEMPSDGWDIAAWNHGDAPGWDTRIASRNIFTYCVDSRLQPPTEYDGTKYFNAGVMLFSGRYPDWNPGWKESARGCQDQNALNLAVIRGDLRYQGLQRKWNYCHVREITPDIFRNIAHIVHCNQPDLAPCQHSPKRTDLMRQAAELLTGPQTESQQQANTSCRRYGRRK